MTNFLPHSVAANMSLKRWRLSSLGCAIEDLSNRRVLVRAETRPIDRNDTFCCVFFESVQTSFAAVVSAERFFPKGRMRQTSIFVFLGQVPAPLRHRDRVFLGGTEAIKNRDKIMRKEKDMRSRNKNTAVRKLNHTARHDAIATLGEEDELSHANYF